MVISVSPVALNTNGCSWSGHCSTMLLCRTLHLYIFTTFLHLFSCYPLLYVPHFLLPLLLFWLLWSTEFVIVVYKRVSKIIFTRTWAAYPTEDVSLFLQLLSMDRSSWTGGHMKPLLKVVSPILCRSPASNHCCGDFFF